jgi:hypothetical protein
MSVRRLPDHARLTLNTARRSEHLRGNILIFISKKQVFADENEICFIWVVIRSAVLYSA